MTAFANEQNMRVAVYDAAGELVCWCGPYTTLEWRDAVHLFCGDGWTEAGRSYSYSRMSR